MDQFIKSNIESVSAKVGKAPAEYEVIVIGAGMSGCVVAHNLHRAGVQVLVLDKARGTGGRLSSKRLVSEDFDISVDLGAQYFELSDDRFENFSSEADQLIVERLDLAGDDQASRARVHARSRNSSVCRSLLSSIDVAFGSRVESAVWNGDHWCIQVEQKEMVDGVAHKQMRTLSAPKLVLAVPPKQAADLLGEQHSLFSRLSQVAHAPQWVVTLVLPKDQMRRSALRRYQDCGVLPSDILGHVYLDHEKLGRTKSTKFDVVVLHARADWTGAHLDLSKEQAFQALSQALFELTGESPHRVMSTVLAGHTHRWLYARPEASTRLNGEYIQLAEQGLSVCGDYFSSGSDYGVESAFLSASAASKALLSSQVALA